MEPAVAPKPRRRWPWIVAAVVLLVVGTGAAGRYHCVYGGTPSGGDVTVVDLVRKDRWGFYDQFVNLDEVVLWDLETLLRHRRTFQALARAHWLLPSDVHALVALDEAERAADEALRRKQPRRRPAR
jgi:hypothetical protein